MEISYPIFLICVLMFAGLLLIIPVSAETSVTNDINQPSITVSVSPSVPKVGDVVVISGTAKGGNVTPGVIM